MTDSTCRLRCRSKRFEFANRRVELIDIRIITFDCESDCDCDCDSESELTLSPSIRGEAWEDSNDDDVDDDADDDVDTDLNVDAMSTCG